MLTSCVFRNASTMRVSDTTLFAARMRPRKYDTKPAIGSASWMSDNVEVAGKREPCLERRDNAGSRFGS